MIERPFTVRIHASLDEVDAAAWDALFPGEPEDWAFYRAVEESPPEGFRFAAITARGETGALVAAAPVFALDHELASTLPGFAARTVGYVGRIVPALSRLRLLAIGSPLSDTCSMGFAPGLDGTGRAAAFAALVRDGLGPEAARQGANLMLVRGLDPDQLADLAKPLAEAGFATGRSVPIVVLDLTAPSLEAYLAGLKRQHRSYFRNKLKTLPALRVEFRGTADGLEPELHRLYQATLARSDATYGAFDRVGPGFFQAFLARQGPHARLMLFWHGDKLVSFHLFHTGTRRLISAKMGMSYPEARDLNLYFINWLQLIDLACREGLTEIEMGATTYAAKLLFGGRLERRHLNFRFRRPVSNVLARPFYRLVDLEASDDELQRLRAEGASLPGLDDADAAKVRERP